MNPLRNEFSWSISRDAVFQTCPRQYFYTYYGYWNGWKGDAPERTKQIYMLKNLKTRYMWAGEKVHDCIKHTLRNLQRGIAILDVDEIVSITRNQMREEFRSSREKRYRIYPKTCALLEHEYDVTLEDAEWKRIADTVEHCLRNFYRSQIFSRLRELSPQMWLEIEDFSSFYLDRTRIWAVIDCSFRTEDGVTIIDWKTGRGSESDLSLQLACYGMYAVETWGVKPGRVRLIEANLLADQSVEFMINAGEIENAKAYIRGSITDMESLLVDAKNNVPKSERFFRKVRDDRIRERCNFRKVCE
jgi:hypothetical protein